MTPGYNVRWRFQMFITMRLFRTLIQQIEAWKRLCSAFLSCFMRHDHQPCVAR